MRIVVAVILWLVATPCMAAVFPTVSAPAAYTATWRQNGMDYEAQLRLRENNVFILHERVTLPDKAVHEYSLTGLWRQVDEGALLQLSNREGQARRLNVGGTGQLYGHLMVARGHPVAVTFTQGEVQKRPWAVTGVVTLQEGKASLRDTASGRNFALAPHPKLDELAKNGTAFRVKADVEDDAQGLKLVRLRTAAPAPADTAVSWLGLFTDMADAFVWRLTADNLPTLGVRFIGQGEGTGLLEVTGTDLRMRAAYTMSDDGITFRVDESDRMPRTPQGEALLRMLADIQNWMLEGEVLVLSRGQKALCILEKFSPARASASITVRKASDVPPPAPRADMGTPNWTEWSR